jgi:aspartyl-tRNA synthetase
VPEGVFRGLGLSDEEAEEKFGFLLEALRMGAPPHGGFAMGIERFVALMAGEPNIREIVGSRRSRVGRTRSPARRHPCRTRFSPSSVCN